MSTMPIKALAPWFGGKRNLAPAIVAEFGEHSAFWDVFCGSMAVLMVKPRSASETVNDLHGDLINLARVIQDSALGPKLYRKLRRTLFCEALLDDAHETLTVLDVAADPLHRAYSYFVKSWMGMSGMAGAKRASRRLCLRFTTKGGDPGTRFGSVVASIPAWRRRLRNVRIVQRDGFELLSKIEDAQGVVVYIDAPYIKKGGEYLHDFTTDDHCRLAGELVRFEEARVVVSYYPDPMLDDLYHGWTRRSFEVSKNLAHQGARGANEIRATELLIINGPSYAECDHGLFGV